jgi:FlaA1/EpsC-like NDP-sugar epimerase
VPKLPSYRITDLAEAIGPGCEHTVVGIRPGEKIHEEMITETDALQAIATEKHYIIVPILFGQSLLSSIEKYANHHRGAPVAKGFSYQSGKNSEWLDVQTLRGMIAQHCMPSGESLP